MPAANLGQQAAYKSSLAYVFDKDAVILDEPEIHLHPEWQMIYAELIVILQQKFDLNFIINVIYRIIIKCTIYIYWIFVSINWGSTWSRSHGKNKGKKR